MAHKIGALTNQIRILRRAIPLPYAGLSPVSSSDLSGPRPHGSERMRVLAEGQVRREGVRTRVSRRQCPGRGGHDYKKGGRGRKRERWKARTPERNVQEWMFKEKQELRQEVAILVKQSNSAKQDVSHRRTGCALGTGGMGARVGKGRSRKGQKGQKGRKGQLFAALEMQADSCFGCDEGHRRHWF